MDGLLDIVSTVTKLQSKQFVQLLEGYDIHQSFSQRPVHELDLTVSLITNSLNSYEKKHEGLLLLRTFIAQCQLDIIEQKGSLWLSLCTKICGQKKPSATVSLSYEVISDILVRSVHIPDLSKSIASTLLSKIIETVNGTPPECYFAALKCLEACMKHYAGPSGSSRGIIDRFLCSLIDSQNHTLILQSGKCLHLLQQVRGGGVQGISQKNAWSLLQSQLLGSAHRVLNEMYANTIETFDVKIDELDSLKTSELNLSADPLERATQLTTRFRNLCEYLRIALSEPFPTAKAVLPTSIFTLISRGLAVDCVTLSKNAITDNIAMGALLPKIHVSLYRLLDTLIILMRSHLLPLSGLVLQTILQSLKWTSSGKASGFRRPYSAIRQAAYHTLSVWCKTMHYGSLVEVIAEDVFRYIIQDATPFQSEVTLQVLAGSRKYLSKKARQKLHRAQNDASNIAQTHSKGFNPHNTKIVYTDNGNESLCAAALNCLVHILNVAGSFLKPVHHKILQEKIVTIALSIVNVTPKQSNLYSDAKCRDALYNALIALVQSPHHLSAPPIQYAVEIFRIAQIHDSSALIREKCANHSRSIEKIVHPQKEVFFFPIDPNEVKEIFKKDGGDARKAITADSSDEDEDEELEFDFTDGDGTTTVAEATEEMAQVTISSQPEPVSKEDGQEKVEDETIESIPPRTSPEQSVEGQSSDLNKTVHEEVEDDDEELPSPPRKSARLSAKRERTDSTSSSVHSRTMSESPLPRRRSTRLSSITAQEASPSRSGDKSQLTTIRETSPQPSTSKTEPDTQTADENEEDERLNELLADFVDDIVEEPVYSDSD